MDLVPTRAINKIRDRLTILLGDKPSININNVVETLTLMRNVGQEINNLSKIMDQIAKGDFVTIEIVNDFDTVIEALRNMNIEDPQTQFLLSLGLGILIITACSCLLLACFCRKLCRKIINGLAENYRM